MTPEALVAEDPVALEELMAETVAVAKRRMARMRSDYRRLQRRVVALTLELDDLALANPGLAVLCAGCRRYKNQGYCCPHCNGASGSTASGPSLYEEVAAGRAEAPRRWP